MEKAGKDEENIDVVILDHAGDIYFAAGKKEQALQYWKKALETYSPELDIDHILKKIHETAKSMEKKKRLFTIICRKVSGVSAYLPPLPAWIKKKSGMVAGWLKDWGSR